MKSFFLNITAELDLKKDTETFLGTYSSIKQIRETFNIKEKFTFTEETEDQVRKEILHLDGSNATPVGDIAGDILKLTVDVPLSTITKVINLSLRNGCFPNDLQSAEDSPIFKKDNYLNWGYIVQFTPHLPHILSVRNTLMNVYG